MRDAQKSRKSWLERLTSPPEADEEQENPEQTGAEQQATPWPEHSPTAVRQRPEHLRDAQEQSQHPLFRAQQPAQQQPAVVGNPYQDSWSGSHHAALSTDNAPDFSVEPDADAPDFEPQRTDPFEPVANGAPDEPANGSAPYVDASDIPPPAPSDAWEGSVTSNIGTPEETTARAYASDQPSSTPWQPAGSRSAGAETVSLREDAELINPVDHTSPTGPVEGDFQIEPELSEDERLEDERRQRIAELQHRWLVTQAQILDDPRDAVREAGLLIGDALQFLTTTYSGHRDRIERSWKNDDALSTDQLRDTMRRYRALFQHVLSVTKIPDDK